MLDALARCHRSFRKAKRLKKISARMATPAGTIEELLRSEIERIIHDKPNPARLAEEELFDLVESDVDLQSVMRAHNATRESLREILRVLQMGAGCWAGGHWVPASTLAFRQTLDYALMYLSDRKPLRVNPHGEPWPSAYSAMDIRLRAVEKLVEYFEKGKVGEVET